MKRVAGGLVILTVVGALVVFSRWWAAHGMRHTRTVGDVLFYGGLQIIMLSPVAAFLLARRILLSRRPPAIDPREDYRDPERPV